jgi:hypothetical protein
MIVVIGHAGHDERAFNLARYAQRGDAPLDILELVARSIGVLADRRGTAGIHVQHLVVLDIERAQLRLHGGVPRDQIRIAQRDQQIPGLDALPVARDDDEIARTVAIFARGTRWRRSARANRHGDSR